MLFILAAVFIGLLWYIANNTLKNEFQWWLKWPALGFVILLVLLEGFFFVETDRLVFAHRCCGETASDNSTTCEECCLTYNTQDACEINDTYLAVGTLDSGTNSSLLYRDSDYYRIELDIDTPYDLYINYSCPSPEWLAFAGRSDVDDNSIYVYDGADWVELYTFDSSAGDIVNAVDLENSQYAQNGIYMLRINSSDFALTDMYANFDQIALVDTTPIKMYCTDSYDTEQIFSYHYSTYMSLGFVSGIILYLGIFFAMALVLQYLWMLYSSYMKGESEGNTPDSKTPQGKWLK